MTVSVAWAAIVVAAAVAAGGGVGDVHVIRELLQVRLLLGQLLLELQKLLLLTLADGVVLVGLLALLEGVAKSTRRQGLAVSLLLVLLVLCAFVWVYTIVCVYYPPRMIISHAMYNPVLFLACESTSSVSNAWFVV